MTIMPFICLFFGIIIGTRNLSKEIMKKIDMGINRVIVILMTTLGMNIGINEEIISELGKIGWNCAVISISGILFSVGLTIMLEKTILPLEKIKKQLKLKNYENRRDEEVEAGKSPLTIIIPISVILGVIIGVFFMDKSYERILNYSLVISLIMLYIGVGIFLGSNLKVLEYVKVIGVKIVLISLAILMGSLLEGAVAGKILGVPENISIISASGMGYYSLTGAFMTSKFGIEAGTYGFIVNIMREFFTVFFLPILIKISKGSAIASGGAGNMDTMLMPITKFVGAELGLVTLITGIILTFSVPVLLPILGKIFIG
ncbi:lysine exporter LysO family protein [Fusobacterium ulcerans]|uniref:lysine exporter LysO family protein n=1 Tax=Fusobacterium ulcerans TaxID=861 RepID=UPI000E519A7F|nr:lysine exporter LysO family protein [Fusobacterium ulcerans]RGY64188.1 lysine exporter LysO family protein [Fusobacterium ulcerans]